VQIIRLQSTPKTVLTFLTADLATN